MHRRPILLVKVGISSANVGGSSRDTTRKGDNKHKSSQSVSQQSRKGAVYKRLSDLSLSRGAVSPLDMEI